MLDTLDLDGSDRRAFDRRKQCPADRIADRRAEAALERLRIKFTVSLRQRFGVDVQPTRHLKTCPIIALCHIFLKSLRFQVSGFRFQVSGFILQVICIATWNLKLETKIPTYYKAQQSTAR